MVTASRSSEARRLVPGGWMTCGPRYGCRRRIFIALPVGGHPQRRRAWDFDQRLPRHNRCTRRQAALRAKPPRTLFRCASPSPREDLVSTMLSEHSKPNGEMDTADSQNCSPGERWERNSAYVAGESGHVRVGPLSGPLDSFDLTCRNVICNRDAGEVAREGSWPSKESKDSNPRQCAWSGRDGEARWTDETWTPSISAFGRSIHCSAGIAGSARPSATCAKPHERPGAIGVRTRRNGEARQ
jgi:hypothetical protein